MPRNEVISFIGHVMDRDHRNIAECLSLIERLLDKKPEPERLTHLRQLTTFLTRRGRQHFNLEERIGELSFVLDDKPWIDAEVQQIRKGHQFLQEKLQDIAVCARALDLGKPASFAALSDQIRSFQTELEQHEEKANRLILDAYNLDIGGLG